MLTDDTGTCKTLVTTCHSFSGLAVVSSFVHAFSVSPLSSATASMAQEKRQSEFHPSWQGGRVTESMSVLTDPTYGILSSELTNCPRGERLFPKSWSGSTPLGGFAREVGAWLGHVDPKHEAGNLIQRITKGTHRATEAWTDGRHAEDDTYVELDC